MSDSTAAQPADGAANKSDTEQINLVPQWLKPRGIAGASPRHAQAPPPPPQPPAVSGNSGSGGPPRPKGDRGTERGDRDRERGDRSERGGDRERGGDNSTRNTRFTSFLQTEGQREQRRPPTSSQGPPQPNSSSRTVPSAQAAAAQGTFEGGRFMLAGDGDRSSNRMPPSTRSGGDDSRGGSDRRDFSSRSGDRQGNFEQRGSGGFYGAQQGSAQDRPPRAVQRPPTAAASHALSSSLDDVPSSTNRVHYSRDELLDLASPSSLESALLSSETPEGIISVDWLEPELRKPFESDDLINAWYESLQNERGGRGGGPRGGASGGPPSVAAVEGPPRAVDWRSGPPNVNWRGGNGPAPGAIGKFDQRTFGGLDDRKGAGAILPPSGGMGLDKMALASQKFAEEMAAIAKGAINKPDTTTPSELKGLLGEPTGNSILDEPLEEGLDRPPEEEIIPQEEAIDFDGRAPEDEQPQAPNAKFEMEERASSQPQARQQVVQLPVITPSVVPPVAALPSIPGLGAAATMLPQVPLGGLEGFKPNYLPRVGGMNPLDPWNAQASAVNASNIGGAGAGGLDLLSAGGVFPPQMKPQNQILQPQNPLLGVQQRAPTMMPQQGQQQGRQGFVIAPQQMMAPPPPPPTMQAPQQMMMSLDEWYYKDPQNAIQGPFTSKEMKEWLEMGYFSPDLPISFGMHGTGKFHPLVALYSDLRVAFTYLPKGMVNVMAPHPQSASSLPMNLGPTIMPQMGGNMAPHMMPPSPSAAPPPQQQQQAQQKQQQQQQAQQQQQQQQAQQQQQQQVQQQQQQQKKAMEEQQQRQAQLAAQEKQQQLLQQQQQQERVRKEQEERQMRKDQEEALQLAQQMEAEDAKRKQAPLTKPAPWSAAAAQSPQGPSLSQIRAEEERLKKQQSASKDTQPPPSQPVQPSPAKPASSATPAPSSQASQSSNASNPAVPWGKSSQDAPRAPTLKEIQEAEEEERKRQQAQNKDLPAMTMASRVANAAGIETRTWSSAAANPADGTKKPAIPQSVLAPPAKSQPASQASKPIAASSQPPASKASAQSPAKEAGKPKEQASTAKGASPAAVVVHNPNATMSAEFKQWCEDSAPKLGADFSLLEFCYGMENQEEVRETFVSYLGSKPATLTFVDEYLRRVGLDKAAWSSKPSSAGAAAAQPESEWKAAASTGAGGAKAGAKSKNKRG